MIAYPDHPGFKATDTSEHAAKIAADEAERTREQCLNLLQWQALSSDEMATILRKKVETVRSRNSELKTSGLIFDSGERRKNENSISTIVWTTDSQKNLL